MKRKPGGVWNVPSVQHLVFGLSFRLLSFLSQVWGLSHRQRNAPSLREQQELCASRCSASVYPISSLEIQGLCRVTPSLVILKDRALL
ncbi:hypothetical protein BC567DRAFT_65546 [Phyllosticta citribraziliensis]